MRTSVLIVILAISLNAVLAAPQNPRFSVFSVQKTRLNKLKGLAHSKPASVVNPNLSRSELADLASKALSDFIIAETITADALSYVLEDNFPLLINVFAIFEGRENQVMSIVDDVTAKFSEAPMNELTLLVKKGAESALALMSTASLEAELLVAQEDPELLRELLVLTLQFRTAVEEALDPLIQLKTPPESKASAGRAM